MKTNEAQFYEVLENLFIGVKIEDKQESLLDPSRYYKPIKSYKEL